MITENVLHLEYCRHCKGKGELGRMGDHLIICTLCGSGGWVWRERCALVSSGS